MTIYIDTTRSKNTPAIQNQYEYIEVCEGQKRWTGWTGYVTYICEGKKKVVANPMIPISIREMSERGYRKADLLETYGFCRKYKN